MASIRISQATRQLLHNGKGRPISSSLRSTSSPFSRRPQRSNLVASIGSARFASTAAPAAASSNVSSGVQNPTPSLESAPSDLVTPVQSFQDTVESQSLDIHQHIGYLKELGLDYGWGPSSALQWAIEHFQVDGGLSMIAAVTASIVVTRLALIPLLFKASDSQARMSVMSPIIKPLQQKMTAAAAAGDKLVQMQSRDELRKVMKRSGVSYIDMFMPMLFQIPFGFALFRVTRGMANLPLPELQNTTLGWISDFSMSDPYYLLPASGSFLMYLAIKNGGETGGQQNQMTTSVMKFMRYGMPTLSFMVTAFQPGITQVGFLISTLWAAGQGALIRNAVVRKFLRIHPLPDLAATPSPSGAEPKAYSGTLNRDGLASEPEKPKPTLLGQAKQKWQETADKANKLVEQRQGKKHERLTAQQLKDAAAYEARKKRAEKEDELYEKERQREQRLRRLSQKTKN